MFRIKPIAGFLVCFLIVFAVLILPLQEAYAAYFRVSGNALFGSYSSVASVRFEPLQDDDSQLDTKIVFTDRQSGATGWIGVGTRFQGYTPTAFVVALVLATPLPWSRRWRALVWSLLAISAFVALRQFIFIANVIYIDREAKVKNTLDKVLEFAFWVGVESFAGVFVIPLGIWILVSFRRSDLEKILKTGGAKG